MFVTHMSHNFKDAILCTSYIPQHCFNCMMDAVLCTWWRREDNYQLYLNNTGEEKIHKLTRRYYMASFRRLS